MSIFDRMMAAVNYGLAVFLGWLGDFSIQNLASVVSIVLACCTFAVYWYYSHKKLQLLASGRISRAEYDRAGR